MSEPTQILRRAGFSDRRLCQKPAAESAAPLRVGEDSARSPRHSGGHGDPDRQCAV